MMRSGILGIAALAVAVVLAIVALSSTFTVPQRNQALVLRFGEPVPDRGLVTKPGLHFKIPFIENVIYIDNRLLHVETPNLQVLSSDRQRLEVDAFAIYRISDALKFYQTVGTVTQAENQIASILDTELRRVLSMANQQEIVNTKRAELVARTRDLVNKEGLGLGVNVIDVRIRRADLPREISDKVFERMRSERVQEAADYRGQGAQAYATIKAKADRQITVLTADAQQKADQTKGQGEAEANQIFGTAGAQDPDFFNFWLSMAAFDASLKPENTRLVLNPSWQFLRYFYSPTPSSQATAKAADAAKPTPAAATPAQAPPAPPAQSPVPSPGH